MDTNGLNTLYFWLVLFSKVDMWLFTNLFFFQKCETPEETKEGQIDAVGVNNDQAEIILTSGDCLTLPTSVLKAALLVVTDDEAEAATTKWPCSLSLHNEGQ